MSFAQHLPDTGVSAPAQSSDLVLDPTVKHVAEHAFDSAYPHLAQNLVEQVKDDKRVLHYMNDKFALSKRPSRQFHIDIINTVHPGFFQELIEAQTNARFEARASEEVGDHILATAEWAEALAAHPFESSKYLQYPATHLLLAQRKRERYSRS